ncbi:MAG: hypothetical protein KGI71_06305 [Patescibacteria group bacterium]|nr:hypothetical protein [Patescibacteria group bacterium]
MASDQQKTQMILDKVAEAVVGEITWNSLFGFRFSVKHGGYMRVTPLRRGVMRIDFLPLGEKADWTMRIWEIADGCLLPDWEAVDKSFLIKRLRLIKRPFTIFRNESSIFGRR